MDISMLHTSLSEHFLRFKSTTTRGNKGISCGLLAELAYRFRINFSLMLYYSVLVCLFVSVNFSFNVSGPFHDDDEQ